MSKSDDRVALTDMRNYVEEAVAVLSEASLTGLAENRVLDLALRKLVEIVGEAANRVLRRRGGVTRRFPGRKLSECATDWCAAMTTLALKECGTR